jgi:hypothetical protein
MGYYLVDDIYPSWSTIVKLILFPQGNKRIYFSRAHESARKDVDRAFGVLQACFIIVRGLACFFQPGTLKDIMASCIILHYMIIEDGGHLNGNEGFDYEQVNKSPLVEH